MIYFIYLILFYRINIIHNNNTVFSGFDFLLPGKILCKKVVSHERGYHHDEIKYKKILAKYYDHVFCVSEFVKLNLIQFNLNENKLTTVYNSLDVNKFISQVTKTPNEIKAEYSIPEQNILIGMIGNYQRWKGQFIVVESFKKISKTNPNITCLFVGGISNYEIDQKYYKELLAEISNLKLDNKIIVSNYRSDIPDILNAIDIFIHASIDPEPFGRVLVEAMSLCKAIIATGIGGPSEILIDGFSGILIKPNDVESLISALYDLIGNKEKRVRLGQNAFNSIKKNFTHYAIDKIENIYFS